MFFLCSVMWKHGKIMHIHVKTRPTYNYAHPIDMEKENCDIVTNVIDWLLGSGSRETKAVLKSKYVIIMTVASTCTVCLDNPVQCCWTTSKMRMTIRCGMGDTKMVKDIKVLCPVLPCWSPYRRDQGGQQHPR